MPRRLTCAACGLAAILIGGCHSHAAVSPADPAAAAAVPARVADESAPEERCAVDTRDVEFNNGEIRLKGTLHLPATGGPAPALVVLHSASGGLRDYHYYDHLTELLPPMGMAVLVFDRRGHGESTGSFQDADFDDLAGDALAAIDHAAAQPEIDGERVGLWGVSQGGWIAPRAAARSGRVAFVISVSGPGVSPAEQMIYSAETSLRIEGYSEDVVRRAVAMRKRIDEYFRGNADRSTVQAEIDRLRDEPWFAHAYFPGRGDLPADVRRSKWHQEMDYDPLPVLGDVEAPMLFLFGANDRWVPVKTSVDEIRASMRGKNVSIVEIEGADHYLMTAVPAGSGAVANDEGLVLSERYRRTLLRWLSEHAEM